MDHSSHMEEMVPLGRPTLRQWEINQNTTRYQRLQAAPSDDDLMVMWSLWIFISGVIALFIGLVLVSILVNRKARSNPFNLFLIYLMVPDLIFSGFCGMTCLFNISAGQYWSASMCQFQAFYLVFGVAANNWLNLCVAWELHSLLRSSRVLKKYQLPSKRRVTATALAVYAYSCFLASWTLWADRFDNFPYRAVSISGLGCFPIEYSDPSSRFYYLVYLPLLAAIPLFVVFGIGIHIWYYKLMPPPGKRRLLVTFFGRIIAAFVIMWLPYFLLCLIGSGRPWLVFSGGSWGHFQGAVSSVIALTKPDIQQAFLRFVRCQSWWSPDAMPTTSSALSSQPITQSVDEPSSAKPTSLLRQEDVSIELPHQSHCNVEEGRMDDPKDIEEMDDDELF